MIKLSRPGSIRLASKSRRFFRQLKAANSGLAFIEFAYCAPFLFGLIGYGLELTNLANANMQVDQAAHALADNMSRVGLESALSLTQLREADINDGFIGVERQTSGIALKQNGRIFLSSLERNADGGQWIHWQRCYGARTSFSSTFGSAGNGATGTSFQGMGPAGAKAIAPSAGDAVMFVEVVYEYPRLFLKFLPFPSVLIRDHASFIVRDNRDLVGPPNGDGVYNPPTAAPVNGC
jgi:hypothetical protein